MTGKLRILMAAGVVALGLAACGGEGAASKTSALSGRYVGEMAETGWGVEIDFRGDGKAVLTMVEGGNRTDMDCTYQTGEARIALSCFGSSGISISRLDGGDLEADMGGVIVRLKKR